jgi:hypothetical protein
LVDVEADPAKQTTDNPCSKKKKKKATDGLLFVHLHRRLPFLTCKLNFPCQRSFPTVRFFPWATTQMLLLGSHGGETDSVDGAPAPNRFATAGGVIRKNRRAVWSQIRQPFD